MTEAVLERESATNKTDDQIVCKICGGKAHSIKHHLDREHPGVTIESYQLTYPGADLLSPTALRTLEKARKNSPVNKAAAVSGNAAVVGGFVQKPMHELFNLGNEPEAKTAKGAPIPIKVLLDDDYKDMVPEKDEDYVIHIDNLKNALIAMEFNYPLYIWGHAGTGKTTLVELICNATNRPLIRVQHTIGTEEADVVGQWVVRNGETVYELGALPLAMKYGWTYLADEYDFGMPSILAIYQSVLEGKPLMIKNADSANRVIKPHPNFRFVATGNTNGSGDETGLYQGTQIQNAANYDRFNVVIKTEYLPAQMEQKILINKTGIMPKDAEKFTKFAENVRNDFDDNKISLPISPRTLLRAASLGLIRGNFKQGLSLAFTNKLSAVDKATVDGYAQRVFG